MRSEVIYLVGLAITMGMVAAAISYLRGSLHAVLTELCGTARRADFWSAFSHVTLFLVPLLAALSPGPEDSLRQPVVFAVCDQFRAGIFGFVVSLAILGALLSWYIVRHFKEAVAREMGSQLVQKT